jgi:hypothetical protein
MQSFHREIIHKRGDFSGLNYRAPQRGAAATEREQISQTILAAKPRKGAKGAKTPAGNALVFLRVLRLFAAKMVCRFDADVSWGNRVFFEMRCFSWIVHWQKNPEGGKQGAKIAVRGWGDRASCDFYCCFGMMQGTGRPSRRR